jgi:hypothetical protein
MKTTKLFGIFAFVLALALAMAACGGGGGGPDPDITYTASQIGGYADTADTTGISFTFSDTINGLGVATNNITVSGAATKGAATFTGSGASWTLSPITVSSTETATVKINMAGIMSTTVNVTVYKTPKPDTEVKDVNFPELDSFPVSEAPNKIKDVVNLLLAQSNALENQFNLARDTNTFAESARNVQSQIGRHYGSAPNTSSVKECISPFLATLNNQIAYLYDDPAARELFLARVHAFQTANYLGQRRWYGYNGHPNNRAEQEAAFAEECTALGIPAGNIPQAAQILSEALSGSMPATVKPFADGIIQQWEDTAQFDGWTTDLQQAGYSLAIPRSVQRAVSQSVQELNE